MGETEDWSPDKPLGTETFDARDEGLDSEDQIAPVDVGGAEGERSPDRHLFVDQAEVEEAGVDLDDPERMAVLDGGADDPDGVGAADLPVEPRPGEEGWDLDAGDRLSSQRLEETEE